MNSKQFDNATWGLGDKIFYKGKEYAVEAVDFEERLIGIKSEPDLPAEDIDWVRCENCSFTIPLPTPAPVAGLPKEAEGKAKELVDKLLIVLQDNPNISNDDWNNIIKIKEKLNN